MDEERFTRIKAEVAIGRINRCKGEISDHLDDKVFLLDVIKEVRVIVENLWNDLRILNAMSAAAAGQPDHTCEDTSFVGWAPPCPACIVDERIRSLRFHLHDFGEDRRHWLLQDPLPGNEPMKKLRPKKDPPKDLPGGESLPYGDPALTLRLKIEESKGRPGGVCLGGPLAERLLKEIDKLRDAQTEKKK